MFLNTFYISVTFPDLFYNKMPIWLEPSIILSFLAK